MARKQSQPRRLRASFPPMPSPATSDRRAASYLSRLREWGRQERTAPRPPTEGRCALFAVRFVRGSGGARVHTTPWPWLENCRNRADCDNICGGSCEPQKHLRVGEEWAGTDIFEQTVLRARKMR